MKSWMIFFMFLLCAPLVVADRLDLHLFKEVFASEETVQVVVDLYEYPVYTPDVNMLRVKDVQGAVIRVAPLVNRLRDDQYFYSFDLPVVPTGSYVLELGPVKYVVNQTLKEFFFTYPFQVKSGVGLQVQPAFLWVSPDLEVKVTNPSSTVMVTVNASPELSQVYDRPQVLSADRSRYFSFTLENKTVRHDLFVNFSFDGGFFYLPVFNRQTDTPVVASIIANSSFFVSPMQIVRSLPARGSAAVDLVVMNNASVPVRISFVLSPSLEGIVHVDSSSLQVPPGGSVTQVVWLNKDVRDVQGDVAGDITITSDNQVVSVPVLLSFPAPVAPEVENEPFVAPETKIVESKPKNDSYVGFELFKNKTYTTPEVVRSKTPFILVVVVLLIAIFVFFCW